MNRLFFAAMLMACSTWVAAQAPSIQISEWTQCANEGQTCYTPGSAQVRFGAGGRYSASRNVVDNIDCSVSNFGDPVRGMRKICEYKLDWVRETPRPAREANNGEWVDCANEGGLCQFPGSRLVRFGAQGSYNYRTENRAIPCTVGAFGDPVEGVLKRCQFNRSNPDRGGGPGQGGWRNRDNGPANRWMLCAVERETCRVGASTIVRFGNNNNFNYRQVDREASCTPNVFGDPTPGVMKRCEASTTPIDNRMPRRPAPDEIPPLNDYLWVDCGGQGQMCNFRGGEHVRYGANEVFKVLYATNGIRCNAASFGGDPVRNVPKRCAIYRP